MKEKTDSNHKVTRNRKRQGDFSMKKKKARGGGRKCKSRRKKKKLTSSVSSVGKLLALEMKGPQDPRSIWIRMKIKKILKLILDG